MKGMSRMKRALAVALTMLSLSSAVLANAAHYVRVTSFRSKGIMEEATTQTEFHQLSRKFRLCLLRLCSP